MKLITAGLEEKFIAQGYTDGRDPGKVKVIAKFFCPWGPATWFAVEYSPEDRICFGYANLGDDWCAELGYFSIDELESLKGPFGLRIERDLYFGEHTLKEVLDTKGHL